MMKRPTTDSRKMQRTVAFYLVVFLSVSLLISLYISISSVRTQYIDNERSLYAISGSRFVGTIENGLLYGKSLN